MHLEADGLNPTADAAVDSLRVSNKMVGYEPPTMCFKP
jgi:hypothetical protein